MMDNLFFQKVFGCLAGLALGDALGMPTEFLTSEQIREIFGRVERFVSSPAWHPHSKLSPGYITDDTGQALAVAHAYTDEGLLMPDGVGRMLLEWADHVPIEELRVIIGPSTSKALQVLRNDMSSEKSGISGKTNGAAMRVPPVGLLNPGDWAGAVREAHIACMPTHNTQPAVSGASAVAAAVSEAVQKDSTLDSIIEAAKYGAREGAKLGNWAWETPLEKRIELAEKIVSGASNEEMAVCSLRDYVGVNLFVSESVATAFGLVILTKGDTMRAVEHAANIGGDTDTIGAISGAVCGAWNGVESIDLALLQELEAINGLDLAAEAERLVKIMRRKKGKTQ